MVRCLIAIGGNLGASESLFEAALSRLRRPGIEPARLSRILSTRPVGAEAGDEFLNAAATLDCTVSPDALLSALHEVESQFGRTRTIHWGPRTIDLDLILFGDQIIDEARLVVPHPAMWYRRFVLDPAADVASDLVHPIQKRTIGELQGRLHQKPVRLSVRWVKRSFRGEAGLKCLPETVTSMNDQIEWTMINDGHLAQNAEIDGDHFFANVVIEGTSSKPQQRTQPSNAPFRRITLYGDTQGLIADQLVQLSAAILG